MSSPVTDREREQLSALLDGRLSDEERARLENRIAASADLEKEWKELQRLKSALASLPRHKVRRSFTLKPDAETARKPPSMLFPLKLLSGLAAAGLAVLLALDALPLLGGATLSAAVPAAPAAANESVTSDRNAAVPYTGEIITWSTPTVEAFGKGGGPPGNPANPAMMAPLTQSAVPGPVNAPPPPAVEPPRAAQPTIESTPQNTVEIPPGESPILGIPPAEEQGKVVEPPQEVAPTNSVPIISIHPGIEITLLIIALGAAIAAVVIGRRK
jgi:hypothetical protein